MKNDPIRTKVLSIRLIPNADRFLLKAMQVKEGHRSLCLITTDCDDVSYAALDEATKKADVSVAYARNDACFYSANDDDSIVYFAQCISRPGSYLSEMAGVPEGTAMAYLIAPPLEAVTGLDAALKAADVEMNLFYGPPTETNFAGGLLTGDQAACRAACEAFRETVCRIAEHPMESID